MLQHDIEGLKKELQQCVELTVSHVGVDIATASQSLLQAIPGMIKSIGISVRPKASIDPCFPFYKVVGGEISDSKRRL